MAIVSYAKSLSELAKEGASIAKQSGQLDQYGKMCDTCACKWEQDRTFNYFMAADEAARRLLNDGDFNCHTWDFKCTDKPCTGFQLAKLALANDKEIEQSNILNP